MWKQILDFDTHAKGAGSTVKRIISGALDKRPLGGSAAIITVGDRPNWTGQILHQANIYAYGRLSWDADLSVEQITEEWVRETFGNDPVVLRTVSKILLNSWAAEADTAWPLGLGGPMTVKSDIPDDRYTWSGNCPGPEKRDKYHGADSRGVGIDRTSKTGTGYLRQYHPRAAALFESPATCPQDYLLFFHHLPYTYRLPSGKTVIQGIYDALFSSVERFESMSRDWAGLKDRIDSERHTDILGRFRMQVEDAQTWRDVMARYFFTVSGIADEKGRLPAAAPKGKSK
jgi:alpha-glucuronidase